MKINLLFVVFCCFVTMARAQSFTASQVLEQSAAVLKNANLFQYVSEYRIKFFDSPDTSAFTRYNCTVARAPEDTILNYHARVYNNEEDRIYDGENFFLIWHASKKMLTDNPYVTGRSFVKNNIRRENIPVFFYADKPFNSYLTQAVKTNMEESVWQGKSVWRIEVWMPTDAELTFFKRVVYIDQTSFLPLRVESFAKFQDVQDEYWELRLDWKSIDKTGHEPFSNHYTYPEGYETEVYKPSSIDLSLLPVGAPAPPFSGTDLQGRTIALDGSEQGALLLLDFWYLGCTPCIRAMPGVNAFAEKYNREGLVVLGLNPIDDFEQRVSDLGAFAQKMNLTYPLVSVLQSVAQAYLVKVFPAMYLIENGRVVYAHYGHSEEKMKALEDAIIRVVEK